MTIIEYNKCVDDFSDGIFRFLVKSTRNEDLARDLVQDSFMKMWIRRKDIQFTKGKSYLFSTAYHTMIDHVRKHERMTNFDVQEQDGGITYDTYSDLKEILNKAVDRLPAIQKSVVLLRDYEGYSYQEVGEITGLSEAQVKVYIYRARLFLKKYIVSPDLVV